ncbi:MAG: L-threonine 3-dehydrogenase [Acidimicrobiales bacterium]
MTTMRALRKVHAGPGLEICEIERPTPGPTEVLIEVAQMGICGTDLHIDDWDEWAAATIPVPLTIGHECFGHVVQIGDQVTDREHTGVVEGARVRAEGHLTCGYCRNCRAGQRHLCRNTIGVGVGRDGAFAEYLCVPAANVYVIPDHIDDDTATVLDPLGNAVHTALTFDLVGEDVLITGAGPIGLMAIPIAQRAGARHVVVTDLHPERLELARRMGATRAVDPRSTTLADVMAELGMTEGFDVGLEMSGAPAGLAAMVDAMHHGGRIALLGILPSGAGIDWTKVIFRGLTLRGVYGRRVFETWYKAAALLQDGLDLGPHCSPTVLDR